MWLIVGLGNPGRKYSRTRHNIGFLALEEISRHHTIPIRYSKEHGYGKGVIHGQPVKLVEPLLFMNRSGTVVRKFLSKSSLPVYLLVLHDDLDLALGTIRIRRTGSSGGHKGVESIIQSIGSNDFIRLKIGIGRNMDMPAEEYVLRSFKRHELSIVKNVLQDSADAVEAIVTDGVDKAMNTFNQKSADNSSKNSLT